MNCFLSIENLATIVRRENISASINVECNNITYRHQFWSILSGLDIQLAYAYVSLCWLMLDSPSYAGQLMSGILPGISCSCLPFNDDNVDFYLRWLSFLFDTITWNITSIWSGTANLSWPNNQPEKTVAFVAKRLKCGLHCPEIKIISNDCGPGTCGSDGSELACNHYSLDLQSLYQTRLRKGKLKIMDWKETDGFDGITEMDAAN